MKQETEMVAEKSEAPPARQHTWIEDGSTFTVEEDPHSDLPKLIGERFHGGTWTEGPLAREVLRLSGSLEDASEEVHLQIKENSRLADENLRFTDRVNALTARIEEALDLLIHETEGSRRVERAYRMLEAALLNTTNTTGSQTRGTK